MKRNELIGIGAAIAMPLLIYGISNLQGIYFTFSSIVLHFIIELFSIIVGIVIFYFAVQGFRKTGDRQILLLGSAFLLLGLIDMFHTFAFKNMPAIIVPTGAAYATYYWILSKVFGVVLLFLSILLPNAVVNEKYRKKLVSCATVSIVIFSLFIGWFVANYIEILPPVFIEGVGLTPLKIYLEYSVMLLLAVTSLICLRMFMKTGNKVLYWFILGFIFFIMSELSFTFYKDVWDTYIWLGHLFKVASYSLFLMGLVRLGKKS
ncbi:MAG: MASE3 domain-containing protein [Candidatus Aenigmatarchaeota archaeon]